MAFEQQIVGGDINMEGSSNVTALTYDALGNYSGGGIPQYTAVVIDTATGGVNDVRLPTVANAQIIGIAQSAPATGPGQSCRVRVYGISKAQASAAITVGQQVAVANTSGQLGPAPAGTATNTYIVGVALTPASAAGDLFSVLLMPGASTVVTS
jgi:hypothetical protein